jgi:hypothetical protein
VDITLASSAACEGVATVQGGVSDDVALVLADDKEDALADDDAVFNGICASK